MLRRSRSPGTTRRAPVRLLAALCLALAGAAPLPAPVRAQAPRTITLQAPGDGAAITDPVEVRGRVTVAPFENNLVGTVYDAAGRALGQGPVPVTPDDPATPGGPGSFGATLSFTAGAGGAGRVAVADVSQADGSVLASASVDVVLPGSAPPRRRRPAGSISPWPAPAGTSPAAPSRRRPPFQGNADPRCAAAERPAETPEDRQVVAAGWRLFREYQGGWDSRLLFGLSGYDGMCPPAGLPGLRLPPRASPGRSPPSRWTHAPTAPWRTWPGRRPARAPSPRSGPPTAATGRRTPCAVRRPPARSRSRCGRPGSSPAPASSSRCRCRPHPTRRAEPPPARSVPARAGG